MVKVTSLPVHFLCLLPKSPISICQHSLSELGEPWIASLCMSWDRLGLSKSNKIIVGFQLLWTRNNPVSCYEAVSTTENPLDHSELGGGGEGLEKLCVTSTFSLLKPILQESCPDLVIRPASL